MWMLGTETIPGIQAEGQWVDSFPRNVGLFEESASVSITLFIT